MQNALLDFSVIHIQISILIFQVSDSFYTLTTFYSGNPISSSLKYNTNCGANILCTTDNLRVIFKTNKHSKYLITFIK